MVIFETWVNGQLCLREGEEFITPWPCLLGMAHGLHTKTKDIIITNTNQDELYYFVLAAGAETITIETEYPCVLWASSILGEGIIDIDDATSIGLYHFAVLYIGDGEINITKFPVFLQHHSYCYADSSSLSIVESVIARLIRHALLIPVEFSVSIVPEQNSLKKYSLISAESIVYSINQQPVFFVVNRELNTTSSALALDSDEVYLIKDNYLIAVGQAVTLLSDPIHLLCTFVLTSLPGSVIIDPQLVNLYLNRVIFSAGSSFFIRCFSMLFRYFHLEADGFTWTFVYYPHPHSFYPSDLIYRNIIKLPEKRKRNLSEQRGFEDEEE